MLGIVVTFNYHVLKLIKKEFDEDVLRLRNQTRLKIVIYF